MRSFNSFENIAKSWQLPDKWLPDFEQYLAHTHKVLPYEPLLDHVQLVNEYALRLVQAHGLDGVVDRLVDNLLDQCSGIQTTGNYLKELFFSTILFHDYGKINPNFQVEKMKNTRFFSSDESIKIGSEHSRLSAYLYLNYHVAAIEQEERFNDDEQVFLKTLTFLFADSIFLHHSGSFYHEVKLNDALMPCLRRFLYLLGSDMNREEQILDHVGLFRYFREEWNPLKGYFPVFALMKLSFSLLTASDYLATNEYMNGFSVSDFGLLDENLKKAFRKNFQSMKAYNRDLFQQYDFYKNLPFEELQERNGKNLNLLRQKLTVEVLETIRQNTDGRLFYLEAPTGAGKTNLSLALASELLEKNAELNKIFYVFPFTTLITQTFRGIQETIGLDNNQLIQLHSKTGFHQKEESKDGLYGNEKINFIDNLFINYPVTLLTHIRFFDILKGNYKENNYILHRLSNSVIITDELQSYNPRHWDKIIFYLSEFARFFNIRFVLMSATLPYVDELLDEKSPMRGKAVRLVNDKNKYFLNPNFGERVVFNFELLEKWKRPSGTEEREAYINNLKQFLLEKAENRVSNYQGKVKVIIEFIKKKSASAFYRKVCADPQFESYQKFLISGEILETRRREIISAVKEGAFEKILLVTTQVVEAGVDIDMDLGFKDKSIVDSDEQLAGRVNRNANKLDCVLYLFDFDEKKSVYGKDDRYKMKISPQNYKQILETKDFQMLYNLVKTEIQKRNDNEYLAENLPEYLGHFKSFDFRKINHQFRLIEENTLSVFVPLKVPSRHLEEDIRILKMFGISPDEDENINGELVWNCYESLLIQSQDRSTDFIANQVLIKQMSGLLSKFIFSLYVNPNNQSHALIPYGEEKFGYFYLTRWEKDGIYSLDGGLNMDVIENDIFL